MHTLVKRHFVWIWIALAAVLFSALAPTISHAMAAAATASAGADDEMQVCTMDGMKMVSVDARPAGPFDPHKLDLHKLDHFMEHCPYCVLHGALVAMPPPAPVVFAMPAVAALYPPLFYQSATPLFSWRAARPRGPPGAA